jgi:hypothetical protein
MINQLWRLLRAEVALHKHNKVNRQGVVSANAQHYHVIENVLPHHIYEGLLDAVSELHAQAVRENSHWRKGMAIGGHELNSSTVKPWLEYFSGDEFIQSLLFYDAPKGTEEIGDGTDWHMDGNIYLGARWAGILTLIEDTLDTTSKLELQPFGDVAQIPKRNLRNSLVLFQGDHVLHRVRALISDERRVVMSLLFSDWPIRTRNPWLRRYQSDVNRAFYGNPQA